MENSLTNQQGTINDSYAPVTKLPADQEPASNTQELDAAYLADYYQNELLQAKKTQAQKDMIYGALWCVGGTVLTMADIGFIFWGAILFGGIQFFKGLINYS